MKHVISKKQKLVIVNDMVRRIPVLSLMFVIIWFISLLSLLSK